MLSRVVLNVATRSSTSSLLTSATSNSINITYLSSLSDYKLLVQKCISQTLWSQEGARSSFLLDLYQGEMGAIYLKLAEKSEGRKGEVFVDLADFSKFSIGLGNVYESGFASEQCISLSDNHQCSFLHLGDEIKIRKKGSKNIESGLVFVSVGEVEEIVKTIEELEVIGLEKNS